MLKHREYYRRYLPHYHPPGGRLLVTFRLRGSLPAQAVQSLKEERDRQMKELAGIRQARIRHAHALQLQENLFSKYEALLDGRSSGPHWLTNEKVASMVFDSIKRRSGVAYDLNAFTIMPNHVHLVVGLMEDNGRPFWSVMQSLKGYTGRAANKLLSRRGSFWQPESYDHVIRDDDELRNTLAYVVNNPVKAGLVTSWEKWPWTWSRWSPGL